MCTFSFCWIVVVFDCRLLLVLSKTSGAGHLGLNPCPWNGWVEANFGDWDEMNVIFSSLTGALLPTLKLDSWGLRNSEVVMVTLPQPPGFFLFYTTICSWDHTTLSLHNTYTCRLLPGLGLFVLFPRSLNSLEVTHLGSPNKRAGFFAFITSRLLVTWAHEGILAVTRISGYETWLFLCVRG